MTKLLAQQRFGRGIFCRDRIGKKNIRVLVSFRHGLAHFLPVQIMFFRAKSISFPRRSNTGFAQKNISLSHFNHAPTSSANGPAH